jgi:hypothetical protein
VPPQGRSDLPGLAPQAKEAGAPPRADVRLAASPAAPAKDGAAPAQQAEAVTPSELRTPSHSWNRSVTHRLPRPDSPRTEAQPMVVPGAPDRKKKRKPSRRVSARRSAKSRNAQGHDRPVCSLRGVRSALGCRRRLLLRRRGCVLSGRGCRGDSLADHPEACPERACAAAVDLDRPPSERRVSSDPPRPRDAAVPGMFRVESLSLRRAALVKNSDCAAPRRDDMCDERRVRVSSGRRRDAH